MSNLLSTDINSRYLQDALGDAEHQEREQHRRPERAAVVLRQGGLQLRREVRRERHASGRTARRGSVPSNRWGTFPAFGLGWRMSKEPFLANNQMFSDVMLRFGWGVTGNQAIPSGRIVSQFGGSRGDTYYDITGSNSSGRRGLQADVAGQRGPEVGGEPVHQRRRRRLAVRRQGQLRRRLVQAQDEQPAVRPAGARDGRHRRAADRQHREDEEHRRRFLHRLTSAERGTPPSTAATTRTRSCRSMAGHGLLLRPDLDAHRQPGHQQGRPSDRRVLRPAWPTAYFRDAADSAAHQGGTGATCGSAQCRVTAAGPAASSSGT